MATTQETLALALRHHQAGDRQQAEHLYRLALQAEPHNADAWHLLGLLIHQAGRPDLALPYLGQAVALQPDNPAFHVVLGVILKSAGRPAEAEACYREALRLRPDYPEAHNNLGNALYAQGRPAEAEACCREALRLRPGFPEAHSNLANALLDQGRPAEAEACYREALRLRPNLPEAYNNLGKALLDQGRPAEAEACCREALRLRPAYPEAHSNLGNALLDQDRPAEAEACCREALRLRLDLPEAHSSLGNALRDQGRPAEAEACCREALRLRPGYPEAYNNLGNALLDQGRPAEAEACYREALRLRPGLPEAPNNLGDALLDQGRPAEAEVCYREALRLRPDLPEAHNNRAMLWLLQGDWQRGWAEYEWRWRCPGHAPRPFAQPLWDGAPLAGRTILLHAEQGHGDTLQFCRFAPLIRQRGGRVLLECQPPLLRLLRGLAGVEQVVPRGEPLPPFDVHAPLLSLPAILKATAETIPAQVPYLAADPALAARWRQQLSGAGYKVGIAWQGSPAHKGDRRRSVPLAHFDPLAQVRGVRLFSLQVGPGTEQLPLAGFAVEEVGGRLADFADTAAVLQSLDLVVTVDTALAHLAGALAVPAWVALPFAPDWRWLLHREDSPWYPSLRLFRQRQLADWNEVFARIAREMENLIP